MRSSMYRPRTNSGRGGGGRGGVGRGGSSGAGTARLAVPRPVQTSSLKSESGVFDLTTILVPAASKDNNGAGTWGRTVEKKAEPEVITHGSSLPSGGGAPASTSDRTSSAVPREAEPVGRSLGLAPPSDAATTGVVSSASVATTDPSAPPLPRNENSAALRAPGNPLSVRPVVVPQSSPPPLRPSVATVTSPTTTRSRGGIPPTLSDQLFPPLSMDRQLDKNPVGGAESAAASGKAGVPKSSWVDLSLDQHPTPPAADAAMVVMEPAPSVFQTPSPDDAETAEERERRRRALALEQQRLILQQVEAARAARAAATQKKTLPPSPQQHPQKSVNRIMRRSAVGTSDVPRTIEPKTVAVPPPERPAVTRKGPRTKGRLYARLPDGTLVEDQPHPDATAAGENYDPNDESKASLSETGTKADSSPMPATVAAEDESSPSVPVPVDKVDATKDATQWKSVQGKPTKKKSWGSQKRRPKKHQVAAVNN